MSENSHPYSFLRLKQKVISEATKPYSAKGKSVKRCSQCFLGEFACLCPWQVTSSLHIDIILIYHRTEVCRPTNTGRLIADMFPQQTYAFCWDRLSPDPELLAILQDSARDVFLLFPVDQEQFPERPVYSPKHVLANPPNRLGQRLTLVLFDGTWRQASRMFRASAWLKPYACLQLDTLKSGEYQVRKAHSENQLSTAEAASQAILELGDEPNARLLQAYFSVFNEHYLATRGNRAPVIGEYHHVLKMSRK